MIHCVNQSIAKSIVAWTNPFRANLPRLAGALLACCTLLISCPDQVLAAAKPTGKSPSANPTPAPSRRIKFETIGTKDGLANPIVFDVVQDNAGFLWMATNNGLSRYDGYSFKTYLPDDVHAIHENSDGVWNTDGLRIALNVSPPWWQTWWFIAVIAGVVCAILAAVATYLKRLASEITERLHAEKELRDAKDFTETALNSQQDTFFLFEPDTGKAVRWNQAFNDITGYADEEIASMKAPDSYYSPEDIERAAIAIQEIMKTGTATVELDLICKDGHTVPTEYKVSVIRDEDGGAKHLISIGRDVTERRRTEQALRKSEADLNAAGRMANVGGWELVPKIMEVRWTDQIYHIYGLSVGQMPSLEENLSFYHPDDRPRLITSLQRAIDHGEPYDLELRFTTAQGRKLWVHTLCQPVVENGETVLLQGTFQDITEHKQAEEELHKEKAFSDAAIASLPGIFYVYDEHGKFLRWNRNLETVTGYSPDEISQMRPVEFFPPDERDHVKEAIGEVFSHGWGSVEANFTAKNGSLTPYLLTGARFEIDGVRCLAGMGLDIGDRVRTARRLQAEQIFTDTIIQSMPGLFYIFEESSARFFRRNANWAKISGYSDEELDAMTALDVVADRDLCAERMQEVYDTGRSAMENHLLTKSGEQVPYYFTGEKLVVDGKTYLVGLGLDISARKQAEGERNRLEEQLRQAQKMEAVGELAGGIAHDFNNILTAIQGNAELLKMELPSDGQLAGFAGEVIRGANRAADLTKQLLAFARKGKWRVTPVNIHSVINQTADMLTHSIDRRIDISLELNASPCTVMGDPTQLQNAMLNLGVNARDAMPDGGTLTYATRNVALSQSDCDEQSLELAPGRFLEINVADTGAGMDADTQKRIFEPFFTTKGVGKGTGLGLAGVYGCIMNHDGKISVYSEPGYGSTFKIMLPLSGEETAATTQTVASDAPARGTGHILIVDDEESIRNFVWTSLENLGYTVSACNDGAAGVDYYRKHYREIDLVILDLIMPKMSGQDVFSEMKKIDPDVKVLISSGFSHTQATTQMLDQGALALLNKPFQITELAETVAKHLQCD